MDVSIIVVNYNTKELTIKCIHDVIKHTQDVVYEIIVVDNNSHDGSAEKIKEIFPEIVLIANQENKGFGAANNQAIKIANGEFLFLLNSDAFLLSNATKRFHEFMKNPQNRQVAVVGGNLISGGSHPICSSGNFPTLLELALLLGPYLLMRSYFREKISTGVVNKSKEIKKVDYIIGANMFIRKKVLDYTGLFDEDFFLNYEETELCYRINKAGFNCLLLPDVTIIHKVGSSYDSVDKSFNFFKFHHFERSRIMFFRKCRGSISAFIAKLLVIQQLFLYKLIGKEKNFMVKAKDILKL